jgi:arsenate reductase (thioredoxin)
VRVLFLCTGNSARSILAEYLLRSMDPRFDTYSAGSHPKGEVHPLALQVLREVYGIKASDARSKSWEKLRDVAFDHVITVCDNARQSCPIWPGNAVMSHWDLEDPAAVEGTEEEKLQAFVETARLLRERLETFRKTA